MQNVEPLIPGWTGTEDLIVIATIATTLRAVRLLSMSGGGSRRTSLGTQINRLRASGMGPDDTLRIGGRTVTLRQLQLLATDRDFDANGTILTPTCRVLLQYFIGRMRC